MIRTTHSCFIVAACACIGLLLSACGSSVVIDDTDNTDDTTTTTTTTTTTATTTSTTTGAGGAGGAGLSDCFPDTDPMCPAEAHYICMPLQQGVCPPATVEGLAGLVDEYIGEDDWTKCKPDPPPLNWCPMADLLDVPCGPFVDEGLCCYDIVVAAVSPCT